MEDLPKPFPARLLDWAGHRSGGVRRLFDVQSGRPSGNVIQTGLLARVHAWVQLLATDTAKTPRAIFLVGGPGNGKTEAVETIVIELDRALGLQGQLVDTITTLFNR